MKECLDIISFKLLICPHCVAKVPVTLFCQECGKILPLLQKDISYFELFGLKEYDVQYNTKDIEERLFLVLRSIHPDKFINLSPQEQDIALSNTILYNSAFEVLSAPFLMINYLLKRLGYDTENIERMKNVSDKILMWSLQLQYKMVEKNTSHSNLKLYQEVEMLLNQHTKNVLQHIHNRDYAKAFTQFPDLQFLNNFQKRIKTQMSKNIMELK